MKKIRILQFTVAQSQGGRTQYILNNWEKIDKERFHFDFATFSKKLDFEEKLKKEGCKVYHFSCYSRDDRDQFIRELDAILDEGYDVLHLHTSYWEDFVVEERAKYKGIKRIIIHSHNTGLSKALSKVEADTGEQRHYKVREQLSIDKATDFWACSKEAAEWLYGDIIPKSIIRIMTNAIDVRKYTFNAEIRRRIRREFGIEEDTILLGTVGRLVYQKNHAFLFRVLKILAVTNNIKLLIVGDGALATEYVNLVHDMELDNQVIFAGYRKDVEDVLQGMDVFCLPSINEAFGISLLEAQCSNLQCVASDVVSSDVIVSDKVFRVPLETSAWVSAIQMAINGYNTQDRYKKNSLVNTNYDINCQIKLLEKGYLGELEDGYT